MKTYQTIIKLLYTSSGWLLKFSFLALPVALFLSISSYLFIDSLLSSYERYLVNSYLGVQGRISIESKDKKFIDELKTYASSNNLSHSIKKELTTSVKLVSQNKILSKSAKFIILDNKYMNDKFKQSNISNNKLFVNQIFTKSMGGIDINSFKQIYFDDKEKVYDIDKFIPIDSGFLNSKPIVFISLDFAKELFGTIKSSKYIIEFMEKENSKIEEIKDNVNILSQKLKTQELKIYDLLLDTKSTKEFFNKVTIVQSGISILIFILSLSIIILSISVSIEFKKNSLKTLQLIGMSSRDLSLTISSVILFMILFVLIVSVVFLGLFQKIFISLVSFSEDFFILFEYSNIFIILLLALFLSIVSFFSTKYIFGKN